MKMNVLQEKAEQCTGKVRERKMGYRNETMRVQAEYRNTEEIRREAEAARARGMRNAIRDFVIMCQFIGFNKESIIKFLVEKVGLVREDAEAETEKHWKQQDG